MSQWSCSVLQGALSTLLEAHIPVQDVPTFPKSGAKGPAPAHHPWPAKKPLPVLNLTQHKPWQEKAHPGPILYIQSTTSPSAGRALSLSAFTSLPWLFLSLGSRECPQQRGCFPDPGSPTPGQGWLPAPTGCSQACGAATAHFLLSSLLHFWPNARLTTSLIGPLGWGRHRREQGSMPAPQPHPFPVLMYRKKRLPRKCDPKPGLATGSSLDRLSLPKSSILPWRGVPGQGQHPEVLRWQSRLRRLCSGLASAPGTGVCHPGFPLRAACLIPRVTGTAGAQGTTNSSGWGSRGDKVANGLPGSSRSQHVDVLLTQALSRSH